MRNGGSRLDSNRSRKDLSCSIEIVLLQIYLAELNQWCAFAGIQFECANKFLFSGIQPIGFSEFLCKTQMRIVEIRGEFDRLFQPLDGALRVVLPNFPHSLFIFLECLFRDIGRQLPDVYNTLPTQSGWPAGRASVQENENVWCPWNIDPIIHVFEAFQTNTNVVG